MTSDYESLKQSAKDRIAKGDLVGLNPHKVLRLCCEIEELYKKSELGPGTKQRVITSLSWLVTDAKHRFDDCRNNLENGSQGGYNPELQEAIDLLDELEAGTEKPQTSQTEAAYRAGFDEAKKIILAEIDKLRR